MPCRSARREGLPINTPTYRPPAGVRRRSPPAQRQPAAQGSLRSRSGFVWRAASTARRASPRPATVTTSGAPEPGARGGGREPSRAQPERSRGFRSGLSLRARRPSRCPRRWPVCWSCRSACPARCGSVRVPSAARVAGERAPAAAARVRLLAISISRLRYGPSASWSTSVDGAPARGVPRIRLTSAGALVCSSAFTPPTPGARASGRAVFVRYQERTMADLVLQGPQLPFVLGGAGTLTLAAGSRAVGRPLPPGTETVFDVQAKGAGSQPLTIGAPGSWSVGLTAGGAATLTAIWRTSAALARQYGLEAYFAAHPDDVVLVFTAGASADGRFAGKMRYAALTASATLEAGSDLSLTYMRGCDAAPPLKDLVTGFFGHVRLPAALDGPPAPGEMLRFQYGGYLQLGGSLGVGYAGERHAVDRPRRAAAVGAVRAERHRQARAAGPGRRLLLGRDQGGRDARLGARDRAQDARAGVHLRGRRVREGHLHAEGPAGVAQRAAGRDRRRQRAQLAEPARPRPHDDRVGRRGVGTRRARRRLPERVAGQGVPRAHRRRLRRRAGARAAGGRSGRRARHDRRRGPRPLLRPRHEPRARRRSGRRAREAGAPALVGRPPGRRQPRRLDARRAT